MEYLPQNEKVFQSAVNMVAHFEGLHLTPYLCPANHLTIGYGHVLRAGESHSPISKDIARVLLLNDFGDCVDHLHKVFPHLWDCQLFALASLSYNIGTEWIRNGSNLCREVSALNRSQSKGGTNAQDQFNVKWYIKRYCHVKKNGKPSVLEGLLRRRFVECDFFDGLIPDFRLYLVSEHYKTVLSNIKNKNYE